MVSFIVKLIPLEVCIDKIIGHEKVEEEKKILLSDDNKEIKIYESLKKLPKAKKKSIEVESPMGEILSIN